MDPPPALERLCATFGLSRFERDILLLCAGVELDAQFAQTVARRNAMHIWLFQPLVWPWLRLPAAPLERAHAGGAAAPLAFDRGRYAETLRPPVEFVSTSACSTISPASPIWTIVWPGWCKPRHRARLASLASGASRDDRELADPARPARNCQ